MNVTITAHAAASTIDPNLHLFDFRADDGVNRFRVELVTFQRRLTLSGATTNSRTAIRTSLPGALTCKPRHGRQWYADDCSASVSGFLSSEISGPCAWLSKSQLRSAQ